MRIFILIFSFYLLGFSAHALYLRKTVYGDGIFYYSWVRSMVVDGDFDFRNEYEHFGVNAFGNKHSIGPAVLWLAPFWLTHQLVRGSGYELPYQISVGATSVLFVLFGLVLLYRNLLRWFSDHSAILTITAIAFATNLLFYGSLDTVNSHGVSFFASALFLAFLFNRQTHLAGIALGFLGVIRHHDLLLGIVALGWFPKKEWSRFFVGAAIGFLPQLIAWQALYGSFWGVPYFAGEGFNFLQPRLLDVLFSTKIGLFVYSPIVLLGFIGLLFWKHRLHLFFYLAILLELLVISSWSTWWQGASYGIRMFVGSLPLVCVGIANAFGQLMRRKILPQWALLVLITTLSLLNGLLIVWFLLST